jgi:hypothetical protein
MIDLKNKIEKQQKIGIIISKYVYLYLVSHWEILKGKNFSLKVEYF